MRRKRAIAVAFTLIAAAVAAWPASVWFRSEQVLRHRYVTTAAKLPRAGAAEVGEGRRLAAIYGCTDCHGADLQGRPFPHPAPFAAVRSANLTRKAARYSDGDFARVVRQGVRPDGTSLWFMPSDAFTHLSGQDLARIVAFVRSVPPAGSDAAEDHPGWTGRRLIASGGFVPTVDLVRTAAPQAPVDAGPTTARGRYLAQTACVECHGYRLTGDGRGTPDLMVAAGYDFSDFKRFMRTGVAAGGRELPMMSAVARKRFSNFTDAEVEALHAYLVARAHMLEDRSRARG